MEATVSVVGIYVHDQDVALDFYVNKLGFSVKTDARNGNYRWLTVAPNAKAGFELGLFLPQEPVLDAKTAAEIQVMVAKGAMPPLVLTVADCRASYETFKRNGVEFVQEPIDRFGSVDANFRDPSGNGWKMVEARK